MKTVIKNSLETIDPGQWDALITESHPLLSHAFLSAMEHHGCLSSKTGWTPQYITIIEADKLIAAMPLYQKTNSWGEFVFDQTWADAYTRYGLNYYPKLVASIPFTPVFGQKLLVLKGREHELCTVLIKAALLLSEQVSISSLHILFPHKKEYEYLNTCSFFKRNDWQYHWRNRDYHSFGDFLAILKIKKRKNIRQERRRVKDQGISFRQLDGCSATHQDWRQFSQFYAMTYARKWGAPIFNQAFFEQIANSLGKRMILVMADKDGVCVAGALMYRSNDTLYGRHWGCGEYFDALHFETCYYQGIDYCIKHKLKVFEPGAQGAHKLARGFEPVLTTSYHMISDKRFSPAVQQFCKNESDAVNTSLSEMISHSAYKPNGE